ncbi:MAG: thiamine diphosphokinase [Ignavibacteria bacterium]|nr:thiamine diphosphokinase [Ignavibacteria bacterium]
MSKQALIICNGEPPSRALSRRLARESALVVAVDGGANIARRHGIKPDIIIGDLDSVSRSTLRFFSTSTILYVSRQDNTDLEKALDLLAARKIRKALIISAIGKRIDFTLGNLSVLWAYTSFVDITFIGDGWKAISVGRKKVVKTRVGTTVSLIPYGDCSGITLKGLRYPLKNAMMKVGEIGASNVVRSSPFTVVVKRGKMLLILLDKTVGTGKKS